MTGARWKLISSIRRHRIANSSFFGCPLTFNADSDALVLSKMDLDRPIPSAEPQVASYLRKRVEEIDVRPQQWDERVSEVIRALLASGDCSVERVAEHFACTRRTIHRHLADCGTTFSKVLDIERADLAQRLLQDRSRPLAGIAGMLGFSAQSAMARWFKGRFGCSITEWRTDVRARTLAAVGRW